MRVWGLVATILFAIGSGVYGYQIEATHQPHAQSTLRDNVVNVRSGRFVNQSNLTEFAREHLARIAKGQPKTSPPPAFKSHASNSTDRISSGPVIQQPTVLYHSVATPSLSGSLPTVSSWTPTAGTPVAVQSPQQYHVHTSQHHAVPYIESAPLVSNAATPATTVVPQTIVHAPPVGNFQPITQPQAANIQAPLPVHTQASTTQGAYEPASSPVIELPPTPSTVPPTYRANTPRRAPALAPYSPSIFSPPQPIGGQSTPGSRRSRRDIRRNRLNRSR